MTPLNKKLSRDLWRLRGQGLAISLVVAAGISLMVGMFGTLVSLRGEPARLSTTAIALLKCLQG